jgi:hypothetical protein
MVLFAGFLLFACKSDQKENQDSSKTISTNDILGTWELVSAKRDGKYTKVLDNTYFVFTADSMGTNFPSKEGVFKYDKIEGEIVTYEDEPTFYKLKTIRSDTLEFSVALKGFTFDMVLQLTEERNTNLDS